MDRSHGLALALVCSALAAWPPDDGRRAWLLVQGGRVSQQNASGIGSAPAFGLSLGRQVTVLWSWEASLLQASPRDQAGLWKARETHFDGSVLLDPFPTSGAWRPYFRAGLGGSSLQSPLSLSLRSSTRMNLVAGLGGQYLFGDRGLGSLEVRSMSIRTYQPRTEVQLLLGLGLRWGASTGQGPVVPDDRPFPGSGPAPLVQRAPEPGPAVITRDDHPAPGGPWVKSADPDSPSRMIETLPREPLSH